MCAGYSKNRSLGKLNSLFKSLHWPSGPSLNADLQQITGAVWSSLLLDKLYHWGAGSPSVCLQSKQFCGWCSQCWIELDPPSPQQTWELCKGLFVDFSSAFNTIMPNFLFAKLIQLSVPTPNPSVDQWDWGNSHPRPSLSVLEILNIALESLGSWALPSLRTWSGTISLKSIEKKAQQRLYFSHQLNSICHRSCWYNSTRWVYPVFIYNSLESKQTTKGSLRGSLSTVRTVQAKAIKKCQWHQAPWAK